MVVTNDSDLLEPIRIVRQELNLPVGILNPHAQTPSKVLVRYASFMRQIRKGVLAASQMLSANAGEVVTTVVKLPFSIPAFAGFLGQTSQPAAAAASAVMATAAASGILSTVSGVGVSPE